ncbi:MAG: hypothetical protein RIT37_770 [Bacteroidota bacterium]
MFAYCFQSLTTLNFTSSLRFLYNMSQSEHTGHQSRYRFPALEAILDISIAAEYLRHQVDKACAPLDINGGQYAILRLLKRSYPEGMSRTEIVKNLIEKTTDVTRQIDSLEKKGLAERIRIKEDRRLSLAKITPAGMEVMEKVDPLFFAMLAEISKTIDEEECKQLSKLCKKMYSTSNEQHR